MSLDFYFPPCEYPEHPCDPEMGEMCDACRESHYWANLPMGGEAAS